MKHFSRALIWLTISEIIFNVAGYVIHASLGRILGPEDYGRFGIIVTLTTMLIVLIGNGVPTAMSKYISEVFEKYPERIRTIKAQTIRLQILIMVPVTIIFYYISPFIASTILRDPTLTPLFQLSAFIIPAFAAASFYFYYYTGLHFFRLQASLKTLRAIARVICIIGLGYYFGVAGAVSGYIVAPLIVFTVALFYDLIKVKPTLPKPDSAYTFPMKELVKYAWPFTLFLIFYELVLTADLFFVKALLQDDYLAGLYNAAITVGRIPYFLFYALTIILLPAIAKSRTEKTDEETKSLVTQSLRLMIIILLPMLTLMFAYGPEVIQFFYGAKYAAALLPYQIFVFGGVFLTVFYVFSFALSGAGRIFIPMYAALGGLILMSALNLTLIPRFGLPGASLAVTLTSFVLMVVILFALVHEFRISLLPKPFLLSLFSSVVIALMTLVLPHGVLWFIPLSAILFSLHLIFLWYTKVLTPRDLGPFGKALKV
jgi:stage V sporulation protein B